MRKCCRKSAFIEFMKNKFKNFIFPQFGDQVKFFTKAAGVVNRDMEIFSFSCYFKMLFGVSLGNLFANSFLIQIFGRSNSYSLSKLLVTDLTFIPSRQSLHSECTPHSFFRTFYENIQKIRKTKNYSKKLYRVKSLSIFAGLHTVP